MLFEIKSRWDGKVIFSLETSSMKLCVEAAIKSRANLYGANLSGANLSDATLYRANLSDANLSGANLSGADLSGADLYGANLYGANLSCANLYGANLSGANLSGANLSDANLSGADLYRANLSGADLYGANLYGANLSCANLYGANLYGADLSGANLYGADLSGANLSRADLSGADLSGAKNSELVIARTQICPTEGAFVGWKKLKNGIIAKLVIPHDAERMNAMGSRKCRASKAFVHELFGANAEYDQHTGMLLYTQGQEVIPDKFDPDIRVECSHGIHFFLTKIEAENY